MKKLLLSLCMISVATTASAADFVDTESADNIIDFGVRVGITSSNLSTDIPGQGDNCTYSWKRGFSTGVVLDLNIRNFFSIRPGFFIENRSYNYTLIDHNAAHQQLSTDIGHTRRTAFNVPVLAAFHFNISNTVKWDVMAGAYFNFGVGDGKDEMERIVVAAPNNEPSSYSYSKSERDFFGDGEMQHRSFDCGLQIGTGIEVMDHYVFEITYQRGLRNTSANHYYNWEMHNKGWTFSIGYNF